MKSFNKRNIVAVLVIIVLAGSVAGLTYLLANDWDRCTVNGIAYDGTTCRSLGLAGTIGKDVEVTTKYEYQVTTGFIGVLLGEDECYAIVDNKRIMANTCSDYYKARIKKVGSKTVSIELVEIGEQTYKDYRSNKGKIEAEWE